MKCNNLYALENTHTRRLRERYEIGPPTNYWCDFLTLKAHATTVVSPDLSRISVSFQTGLLTMYVLPSKYLQSQSFSSFII